jgi:hypothetical protein
VSLLDTVVYDYHSLPSLSSSGARKLLPPSCPAKFKWERDNPPPPKDAYDLGHAAHRFVLGAGEDIALIDYPDRRSKAAKEEIAAARDAGQVPLLAADYYKALAMAKAFKANPLAAAYFTDGQPEVARFWTDAETGVDLRVRFDWLPTVVPGNRMILPDYKTTVSAAPHKFQKSVVDYGYHQQAAWYIDALIALGIDDNPGFVFVAQEKEPPHLATVIELDELALQIGRHQNRKAIRLYVHCLETDTWPGYADDVVTLGLPAWAEARYMDEVAPDEIVVV